MEHTYPTVATLLYCTKVRHIRTWAGGTRVVAGRGWTRAWCTVTGGEMIRRGAHLRTYDREKEREREKVNTTVGAPMLVSSEADLGTNT